MVLPSIVYLLTYSFKWFGWSWHTSYNIPGFFVLFASQPWSIPFITNTIELNQMLGHTIREAVQVFSVIIGFAINFVIVIAVFKYLKRITSRSKTDAESAV